MTDINKIIKNQRNDTNSLMTEIDKKIVLKPYKEGNKHKTIMTGIDDFLKPEEVKGFTKMCKVKLGCTGTISQDDKQKTVIIFSGNHVDAIKQLMISEKITTEEFIKC